MKISINTAVLKKEHLTLGEFLTLLMGYYDVSYHDGLSRLVKKKPARLISQWMQVWHYLLLERQD